MFLYKNSYVEINGCRSKVLYEILISKIVSRGNMESVFSKLFNFECREIWKHIYNQKLNSLHIPKLLEFNYKILHNILPTGYILNKWKSDVSSKCDVCIQIETTEHMLYKCKCILEMWTKVSKSLNINILYISFKNCIRISKEEIS